MRLGRAPRPPRLLTLRAIAARTRERFGSSPLDLDDLVLEPARDRRTADLVEVELGTPLPEAFRRCISRYRLDRLSWHVSFGQGRRSYGHYLVEANVEPRPAGTMAWWEPYERPDGLIMIGRSERFVVLLDLGNGAVLAVSGGQDPRHAIRAAADFELFLRGLGTVLLEGPQDEAVRSWVAREVDGDPSFWRVV